MFSLSFRLSVMEMETTAGQLAEAPHRAVRVTVALSELLAHIFLAMFILCDLTNARRKVIQVVYEWQLANCL
jgi:hypothetical protein